MSNKSQLKDNNSLLQTILGIVSNRQNKEVTAGTEAITVEADAGGILSMVTVNPTPTESKSVTPTTSELTVTPSEGKHLSQVVVGAVEDVTPEVTAQTPIITQIAENLGVTITTPSGTNKQILQGNNANLQLIASETSVKTVTWAGGTDEEIVAMVEAADQGVINLSDYWAVGDIRTVQLSAMSATGVGESHAAQQVDLVLMHAGGYDLNAAVASGRTKCSFVVGLKDSLAEAGYMNSSNTNSGSWNGSARRTWCNNVFRNAIPSTLRAIFKQFKTVTAQTYNGSTNQTSVDYFALPAAKEVFGGSATSAGSATSFSNLTEFNALFQFDYYKTTSNRVKKLGKTGAADGWWERSPYCSGSNTFCRVYSGGTASNDRASNTYGLAPFGCI